MAVGKQRWWLLQEICRLGGGHVYVGGHVFVAVVCVVYSVGVYFDYAEADGVFAQGFSG